MKKYGFAVLAIFIGMTAANAAPNAAPVTGDVCILIAGMQGVFKTLRTLAFVGAAFTIAGWAWGYISSGKAEMPDIKGKGIGLLVGFTLLFSIGIVLQFLGPITGCVLTGW
jgi:hypothetical protein